MDLGQFIFHRALGSTGETGRVFRRARRWMLRVADPLVTWEVKGRQLRLNLSHQLPFYRRDFPTYAANFERLTALLRRQHGRLLLVDVGANIGDSLALAEVRKDEDCLLIEGDPDYFRLLRENTADLPKVVCVAAMLSASAQEASGRLVAEGGTGSIVRDGAGRVWFVTLDQVVQEHPQFTNSHLLKIDVDGYDFCVLRGGERFIRGARPVLFFEQDPGMMQGVGDEADEVYDWLGKTGYERVYLYDNLGYWVGTFHLADNATLRELNAYARQRPGFYYDVIAFAQDHAPVEQVFRAEEKQFYEALRR
jgi:FkbM family methyltransferase